METMLPEPPLLGGGVATGCVGTGVGVGTVAVTTGAGVDVTTGAGVATTLAALATGNCGAVLRGFGV